MSFLKDRYIVENINRILSIMNLTDEETIPDVLVLVDFKKAFDSLEWSFVEKALKCFNFGPSICQWIKVLYHNNNSCILNNGWTSDTFNLHRGVFMATHSPLTVSSWLQKSCQTQSETTRRSRN